jgi:glycosyltransferase involved in cell wall biosynthesis
LICFQHFSFQRFSIYLSMRVFTCTPEAFGGGADFFARDSGLLCRGLQAIGIESRAVMPGERMPEDEADLIRSDDANLESAEWWRSQQLDGVVLYAWGRPRFRKVAAAIRNAGIFLILNQDSAGMVSPRVGWHEWLRAQWIYGGQGRNAAAWMRFLKLAIRGMTVELLLSDRLRGHHLSHGHVIACVSPVAVERYRRLCRAYGGDGMANRVKLLPHSVEPMFGMAENSHPGCFGVRASSLDPVTEPLDCRQDARSPRQAGSLSSKSRKNRQVVCVGRWQDSVQKRTWLLMAVLDRLMQSDADVTIVIAGKATDEMKNWHAALDEGRQCRVRLAGMTERQGLAELLESSQVFYSPSAYESFGIAAAEALCAGCSVVAGRSLTMPSFEWFVAECSGRLAERDDVDGHAAALRTELAAWNGGQRDALRISDIWCERLHADKVAERVVEMIKGRVH